MKRRAAIAAAGTALCSGCLTSRKGGNGGVPPEREIQNLSVSITQESSLSITANAIHSRITADQIARFNIVVTWNGQETQSLGFGNEIPFTEPKYSTSPNGLLLFTTDSGLHRQNENTWLPKTGDDGSLTVNHDLVTGKFHPGDTVSKTWSVWGDPRHVSQIEPGRYSFANSIDLLSSDTDGSTQIDWTMTITIEELAD